MDRFDLQVRARSSAGAPSGSAAPRPSASPPLSTSSNVALGLDHDDA